MKITFLFLTTRAKIITSGILCIINSSLPAECANPNVQKHKYILTISAESHSFAAKAAENASKYFISLDVCICQPLITSFWMLHILPEGVLKASYSWIYLTFKSK